MMKFIEKRHHSGGFTLVEIMMVVLLVSILAGIGISQFTDFATDGRKAVSTEKIMAIKTAIMGDSHFYGSGQYTKQGYEAHCGGPPAALADLLTMPGAGVCSVAYNPFTKIGWRGPYVSNSDSNWNIDAWGITIQYFVGAAPVRTIRSCGPDKICGNTDDISVTY